MLYSKTKKVKLSESNSKHVSFDDVRPEALKMYDAVLENMENIFKDKTVEEKGIAIMMAVTVLEKEVVNQLGEEETIKIKKELSDMLNKQIKGRELTE